MNFGIIKVLFWNCANTDSSEILRITFKDLSSNTGAHLHRFVLQSRLPPHTLNGWFCKRGRRPGAPRPSSRCAAVQTEETFCRCAAPLAGTGDSCGRVSQEASGDHQNILPTVQAPPLFTGESRHSEAEDFTSQRWNIFRQVFDKAALQMIIWRPESRDSIPAFWTNLTSGRSWVKTKPASRRRSCYSHHFGRAEWAVQPSSSHKNFIYIFDLNVFNYQKMIWPS